VCRDGGADCLADTSPIARLAASTTARTGGRAITEPTDTAEARVRAGEAVVRYHERTKHRPERYARSPGFLDWATQPDPFRRFADARQISLDRVAPGAAPSYDALFGAEVVPARPVDRGAISQLFFDSLALSAWKVHGASRWSLRVNPSSGNLHPTEGYLVAGPIASLTDQAGVFHYAPHDHALEERLVLDSATWEVLRRDWPDDTVFVGLASIYWREAWKYGERAFRYCQHDVGHAIAAITVAARILGWSALLLEGIADADLGALLAIDRQEGIEAEHPDCLIALVPGTATDLRATACTWQVPREVVETLATATPAGTPNVLSEDHEHWRIIDEVAAAAAKHTPEADAVGEPTPPATIPGRRGYATLSARQIVRQRRSAVAMDGETPLDRATFYRILQTVVPANNPVVFRTLPWRPCVHLAIFVHRVRDLTPGLYLLAREPRSERLLREAITGDFLWARAEGCPDGLPLLHLATGDARNLVGTISCHQDIASDGCFALGMLAELDGTLAAHGPWFYKRLFWEAGAIGQLLYLEAEAARIRGTGIGCFFDDAMHQLLGIEDRRLQSLYHFTLGAPLDDPRLRTEPPYAHLE
jgi:SagB-type dehydrogenase family enzyme